MTYRELLTLYKTGQLDEDRRKQVESDIEKQDAIGEYLFDAADIPGLDEELPAAAEDGTDTQFLSLIQRSIRRAFVKMGLIVGAVVLTLVLCTIFLLPKVVDHFYYDPTQIVGRDEKNEHLTTERMELDLGVYSELFLPGWYRNQVNVQPEGWGVYHITVPQVVSRTGVFHNVSGILKRNQLIFYDADAFRPPTVNGFLLPEEIISGHNFYHNENGEPGAAAGTVSEARARLESRPEDQLYQGYVSLDKVTDYADFVRWTQTQEDLSPLWCAVYAEYEDGQFIDQIIGLNLRTGGMCQDWDQERYPHLTELENNGDILDLENVELATTHFTSMLSYVEDHPEFAKMMGRSLGSLPRIIRESVERDGLRIYGFMVQGTRDELLALWDDPAVRYIYTTPMR